MMRAMFGLCSGTLLLLAGPAMALPGGASQEATSAASGACELHVWPAAGLDSMVYGWTHGSTVNGSQKGRKGYPALPYDPLSAEAQRTVLSQMPLDTLFDVPGARIVIHDQPLDRRAPAGRHAESTATCYEELVVAKAFYEEAVFSERSLRVLVAFREFGAGPAATRAFTTWAERPLAAFPPATEADRANALDSLREAFAASVRQFSVMRRARFGAAPR